MCIRLTGFVCQDHLEVSDLTVIHHHPTGRIQKQELARGLEGDGRLDPDVLNLRCLRTFRYVWRELRKHLL